MKARRPYARIYLDITEDPRLAGIWDLETLGMVLLLTVEAEKAYPDPAQIPRLIPDPLFSRMEAAGIVERRAHDYFVLVGLDAEREGRSGAARDSANARWHPPDASVMRSYSGRNADPMLAKQNRTKQNRTGGSEDPTGEPPKPLRTVLEGMGLEVPGSVREGDEIQRPVFADSLDLGSGGV